MTSMTRRALYLQDAHPIRDAIAYTQYAEEKGFEAVWQADSRLVREAGVPMAAFGVTTDTIKIGSGVIDVWTRNPARLASMFSRSTTWRRAVSSAAWGLVGSAGGEGRRRSQ